MKLPLEYTGSDPEPGSPPSFKMLVDWCDWAACAAAIEPDDVLPARLVTNQEAIMIARELPPHLALQPAHPAGVEHTFGSGSARFVDWHVLDCSKLLTRFSRPAEQAVA